MERFVIEVDKSKAKFFTDLIKSFDFAEIIKVNSTVEPRIYPATDFEIRPENQSSKTDTTYSSDKTHNTVNGSEINIKQIRNAMSAIDKKREASRK